MHDYKHLDDLLQRFVQRGLPGCAVGVAQGDEVLYEGYHGLADIEANRPITEDTVYRLYSMTKVIICTAAMMLMERGLLHLNDPISEYLPEFSSLTVARQKSDGTYEFSPCSATMLVRHAFTMSVGLPYAYEESPTTVVVREAMSELSKDPGGYTLRQLVRALASVPLAAEPGERFQYGYGHDLVAALIEVITGKSVGSFLQDELFTPLRMTSTGYRYFGDLQQRMVSLYRIEEGSEPQKISIDSDQHHLPGALYEGGGSGLFSSVRDYLKFAQMLANGGIYLGNRIIGRKTIDLMRTNQLSGAVLNRFQNFYNAGYGYGLGVRTMLDPSAAGANNSPGAFGWSGVLGTWVEIDPGEKLAMVYMHQTRPNMEEYHHHRVRAAVYAAVR